METGTVYTLRDAAKMLAWPPEALLSVEYADRRVHLDGCGQYWLDNMTRDDDPWVLFSPWQELRAAVRRGHPSAQEVCVRVRSVSRGVDGYCYV